MAGMTRLAATLLSSLVAGCSCGPSTVPGDSGADPDVPLALPDVPIEAAADTPARECLPDTIFCRDGQLTTCDADGRIGSMEPCPAGSVCAGSECRDPCDALALGATYEGCAFRGTAPPAIMSGHGGPRIPELGFGLHNGESSSSHVEVTGGTLAEPIAIEVAASSSAFVTVPLIGGVFDRAVYGVSATVLARDTASYAIRADVPIVVYQFSPDYGVVLDEARFLMKADATVLFPTHAWGTVYVAATMAPTCRSTPCGPDEMTFLQVTADRDGTMVEVDASVAIEASVEGTVSSTEVTEDPVAAIAAGAVVTFVLDAGDVLQLVSAGDLTGTKVTGSAPIQLISGNIGLHLPDRFSTLGDGHLHESILPVGGWGQSYAVAPPPHPTRDEALDYTVRVVAGIAAANVTFDPPIVAPIALGPREHVDLPIGDVPFRVTSDSPILVLGMSTESDVPTGDSLDQHVGAASMVAFPPFEQWRNEYGFSVPVEFDHGHVTIVHPTGSTVTIDGADVAGAIPIGSTGLSMRSIELDGTSSAHRATSADAFMVVVYGQAAGSSYWYAAGLDSEILL